TLLTVTLLTPLTTSLPPSLLDALPIYADSIRSSSIASTPPITSKCAWLFAKAAAPLATPPTTSLPFVITPFMPDCTVDFPEAARSEEHTSELQSRFDLVCRLLPEIKTT